MIARLPIVDAEAPAERLAVFRVLIGSFTLAYLLIRLWVFLDLADRSDGFDGVGVFGLWSAPLPSAAVVGLIAITLVAAPCFIAGFRFGWTGPVFAVGVLLLTSYRSSWGQFLHFENLFTLHLLIVGFAPAADALSIDAWRTGRRHRPPVAYGWPLRLACVVVAATYLIAGIAKLRYGGLEWVLGDTLRNHIAYSAARLDLLGGPPAPLAEVAVRHDWLLPPMAGAALMVELGAPLALLGGRWRNGWVGAAWAMHLGILVLMLVGFPYPLFLIAFAPFFDLERLTSMFPGDRMRLARSPVA